MRRPDSFGTFHGQQAACQLLRVAVDAARIRRRPLGHVLLSGPPGCGKTTLGCTVIPGELGVPARSIVCSAVEKPQDLLPVLTTMRESEVLFLDEIHALPRVLHETLYSVMEDSTVSVVTGEADKRNVLKVTLPRFTIVGATTRDGLLPEPLRDRFKHSAKLQLYDDASMAEVLTWVAACHEDNPPDGLKLTPGSQRVLTPACHGTARHAVRLIEACADTLVAQGVGMPVITEGTVVETLLRLGFHVESGLNAQELGLLRRLADAPRQTLGLSSLGAMLDEEEATIEEVYEPWLLARGFMVRTPTGRTLTPTGMAVVAAARS